MKNFILFFFVFGVKSISFGQTNAFPSTGYVGIGTANPTAPLEIYKADNAHLKIQSGGGSYSYLHLLDAGSSGYLIKNNTGSAINGATSGSLYTYVDEGYDFQHIENAQPRFTIKSGGNVGIGTISPETKLHLSGNSTLFKLENVSGSANQFVQMNLKAGTADNYIWTNNENSSGFYGGSSALNIYTGQNSPIAFFTNGGNERMRVDGNGNVAIGTTDPQGYKLAVNGNMITESVKVKFHANWPDFVFHKEYPLRSLAEVEKYVQNNSHLPEIPSAEEVKKSGLDLGEMNAKFLLKIEELTLYLIEKDKQVIDLQERVKVLERLVEQVLK